MAFLILGVALLAMKLAEFGPGADWSWWIVLAPFGLATVWWQLADSSGLTRRRAMDEMERKKIDRRNRNLEALGMDPRRQVRVARPKHDSRSAASPTGKRSVKDSTARSKEDASVH